MGDTARKVRRVSAATVIAHGWMGGCSTRMGLSAASTVHSCDLLRAFDEPGAAGVQRAVRWRPRSVEPVTCVAFERERVEATLSTSQEARAERPVRVERLHLAPGHRLPSGAFLIVATCAAPTARAQTRAGPRAPTCSHNRPGRPHTFRSHRWFRHCTSCRSCHPRRTLLPWCPARIDRAHNTRSTTPRRTSFRRFRQNHHPSQCCLHRHQLRCPHRYRRRPRHRPKCLRLHPHRPSAVPHPA